MKHDDKWKSACVWSAGVLFGLGVAYGTVYHAPWCAVMMLVGVVLGLLFKSEL